MFQPPVSVAPAAVSPASVSATLRVVRWNSASPSRRSRPCNAWLTALGVTPELERCATEAAAASDREELRETIEGIGTGHGFLGQLHNHGILTYAGLPVGSLASIRRLTGHRWRTNSRRDCAVQLISVWSGGRLCMRPAAFHINADIHPLRHGRAAQCATRLSAAPAFSSRRSALAP